MNTERMNVMKKITPGRDGLPRRKDDYTPEEKAIIVARAEEVGANAVADAYGFAWQTIASWERHYGKGSEFDMSSKSSKKKSKNQNKNQQKLDAAKKKMIPTRGGAMTVTASNSTAAKTKDIKAALIIQSPSGQEITVEDICVKLSALGNIDRVYIRADEGKAYWVRGEGEEGENGEKEEHGAVDLW